jgi:hypothetical protein
MSSGEKIGHLLEALDTDSADHLGRIREEGYANGNTPSFNDLWEVLMDRFEGDSSYAKALWRDLKCEVERSGGPYPSVDEWRRFENKWRRALLRIGEAVPKSEQYSVLMGQVPLPYRRTIIRHDKLRMLKRPQYLIQGVRGHAPRDVYNFLCRLRGIPASMELVAEAASAGEVVVTVSPKTPPSFDMSWNVIH